MKTSPLRRTRSAGLVVALAAAGLLAVPTTAHAGVLDSAQTQSGVGFNGSGSCTETGPGSVTSPPTPFAADGVPVTTTASSNATYTHNVDNTDVTTMSGSITNTVRATQAGGVLKTVDVDVTSQLSLQASKGTAQACDASVTSSGVAVGSFDLPTAKYVTLQVHSKGSIGAIIFQNSAGPMGGAHQTVSYFLHSRMTQRIYLPAGTWVMIVQNQNIIQAPTPSLTMPNPLSSKLEIDMTLDDPGVATGAAKGDAGKYLALANGRTCATGSLTGKWKKAAGKGDNRKVKKAIFRVNGLKVLTVKKPKKKQVTTLTGLDPDAMADVSVTLKMVEKGVPKLTTERTYLACT
ncbi:hypothetical protein [Nocardioides dilutus]